MNPLAKLQELEGRIKKLEDLTEHHRQAIRETRRENLRLRSRIPEAQIFCGRTVLRIPRKPFILRELQKQLSGG